MLGIFGLSLSDKVSIHIYIWEGTQDTQLSHTVNLGILRGYLRLPAPRGAASAVAGSIPIPTIIPTGMPQAGNQHRHW
jgi:hypothetical protein